MSRAFCLLPLTALVAASLTACGGSSSTASSGSTSGVVTGSYFEHAKVCIDANSNGKCDAGEASTFTDAKGAYTLPGQGNVVVEVGTDAFRNDPDTGAHDVVTQPLVFRAPAGANAIVSAISTELAVQMDDNGGDLAAAKTALAQRLGVAEDKLLADHNKESDPAIKEVLKAEIGEVIALIADAKVNDADFNKGLRERVRKHAALAKNIKNIKNIVVIYAENRGFDNLYGLFPGADGVPGVNPASKGTAVPQKDFDGSVLPVLPQTWGGLTAPGQSVTVTQAQTANWPNKPFQIDDPKGVNGTGVVVPQTVVTTDLVHRFYNNQMQINGGKNDKFPAYSDAGGLSMGYYDGSKMTMWNIAKQYVLADNFFMGTFGGSFLNHQYLVCACVPKYPNADTSVAKGKIAAIDTDADGNFIRLTPAANSQTSALSGPATYLNDGAITPKDASGMFYAVNTMQPPYQPSGNPPATGGNAADADPSKPSTMPTQSQTTIGDLLSARHIDWAWYAGAWNAAQTDRSVIYGGTTQFQPHHQAFNYFSRFDPATATGAAERAAHLKDYDASFLQDAASGKLPAVTFYKPQGNLNQHPGYASVADGDAHIANVIAKLQQSPQWKNMVIVVTYDENGGFYDHAAVPKADRWGPGTRIPAIIVSPFAKKGFVDHTQYDTASVLRLITHRFALPQLPGLKERDRALANNGNKPMGDLTNALDFSQAL